jgi:deazaflavin-dependent oxidoreductase (nitroreductase family)
MSALKSFNADPKAFNRTLIAEFRANGGKVSSIPSNGRLFLLTTTGAKSGQPHTVPLGFARDGERLVIIASINGAPKAPAWYHNLVANPEVTIEVGTERYGAQAVVAEGAERERLVELLATQLPFLAEHEQRAGRQIPIIVLERLGEGVRA